MKTSSRHIGLGGLVWVAVLSSLSFGQAVPINDPSVAAGFTAAENASAAGGRSPGNMVNAGVARALNAIPPTLGRFDIVETTRPTSFRATFLSDAIGIIFTQLDQVISLFDNLLRIRSGNSPALSSGLLSTLGSVAAPTTGTAPATGDVGRQPTRRSLAPPARSPG